MDEADAVSSHTNSTRAKSDDLNRRIPLKATSSRDSQMLDLAPSSSIGSHTPHSDCLAFGRSRRKPQVAACTDLPKPSPARRPRRSPRSGLSPKLGVSTVAPVGRRLLQALEQAEAGDTADLEPNKSGRSVTSRGWRLSDAQCVCKRAFPAQSRLGIHRAGYSWRITGHSKWTVGAPYFAFYELHWSDQMVACGPSQSGVRTDV